MKAKVLHCLSKRGVCGRDGCLWGFSSRFCSPKYPRDCSRGLETWVTLLSAPARPSNLAPAPPVPSQLFLRLLKSFFAYDCWCFQAADFSGSQSGAHEAERKPKEFTTGSFLGSRGCWQVCLLSTFQSLLKFDMSYPAFLVYLWEKQKKYSILSFQGSESP